MICFIHAIGDFFRHFCRKIYSSHPLVQLIFLFTAFLILFYCCSLLFQFPVIFASSILLLSIAVVAGLIFCCIDTSTRSCVVLSIAKCCNIILFTIYLSLFGVSVLSSGIPAKSVFSRFIFPENSRFPLGKADSIAVDDDGNIYVALSWYGRIQKYDTMGCFRSSWAVNSSGGVFAIWYSDGKIHSISSRTDDYEVFDLHGNLINSHKIQNTDQQRKIEKYSSACWGADNAGNTYILYPSTWFPKIVKFNSAEDVIYTIQDPIYIWILKSPIPGLCFGLLTMITFGIIKLIQIRLRAYCSSVSRACNLLHAQSWKREDGA